MDDLLKILGLILTTLVLVVGWIVGDTMRALLTATWTPALTALVACGMIVAMIVLCASARWGLQWIALHLTRITSPSNVNVGAPGAGGLDPRMLDALLNVQRFQREDADRQTGVQLAGGVIDPW